MPTDYTAIAKENVVRTTAVPFIKRDDCFATSIHEFCIEASQLGWPPGDFPNIIATDLGNGERMILITLTESKATYHQRVGCVILTVIND